jgi:phage shock protein A
MNIPNKVAEDNQAIVQAIKEIEEHLQLLDQQYHQMVEQVKQLKAGIAAVTQLYEIRRAQKEAVTRMLLRSANFSQN